MKTLSAQTRRRKEYSPLNSTDQAGLRSLMSFYSFHLAVAERLEEPMGQQKHNNPTQRNNEREEEQQWDRERRKIEALGEWPLSVGSVEMHQKMRQRRKENENEKHWEDQM